MKNNQDILNKLKFEHITELEMVFKNTEEIQEEFSHSKYISYNFGLKYSIQIIGLKCRQYTILFVINNEEILDLFILDLNSNIKFVNIENILILKTTNSFGSLYYKYNLNNIKHKELIEFKEIC